MTALDVPPAVKRNWPQLGLSLLLAPLLVFVPSGGRTADAMKLWLISGAVTTYFLFVTGYILPGGGWHFMAYADALARNEILAPHIAQRDAGYPLLLWLSGYPYHGSLVPLTLFHALFAAVLPLLIHFPMWRLSPTVAFYTALVLIVSLSPILYMKWLHHDHLYIFASFLLLSVLVLSFADKNPAALYRFTGAALIASWSRPVANMLFPVFMALAYVARRGAMRHYLICIGLFAAAAGVYQLHRYMIFDIAHQKVLPGYTGQQVFYNLYMNSAELGVTLSPEIGPNMRRINDSLRRALEPSPTTSPFLKGFTQATPSGKVFYDAEFFPYSTAEMMQRAYTRPNWEIFQMMCDATGDDKVFLNAAIEIVRAHPMLPIKFSLRNLWVFMFDPGYAHTRFNANPFGKIGLAFIPDSGYLQPVGVHPQALREIIVQPLEHLPRQMSYPLDWARAYWLATYHKYVGWTAGLIIVAWIAAAAAALSMLLKAPPAWAARFPFATFTAPVAAISLSLLYNAAVTAVFAEPDYRYHHFVMPMRIWLAGYGVYALAIAVLAATPRARAPSGVSARVVAHDVFRLVESLSPRWRLILAAAPAAVVAVAWGLFISASTRGLVLPPQP